MHAKNIPTNESSFPPSIQMLVCISACLSRKMQVQTQNCKWGLIVSFNVQPSASIGRFARSCADWESLLLASKFLELDIAEAIALLDSFTSATLFSSPMRLIGCVSPGRLNRFRKKYTPDPSAPSDSSTNLQERWLRKKAVQKGVLTSAM